MKFFSDIQLRPYQTKCLEAILTAFDSGKRSIGVSLPTATGKTILFCALIRWVVKQGRKKCLIIAHREELVRQPVERMADVWNDHPGIGVIKAKRFEPDNQIVVSSIQTLCRRLDRLPSFDLVITDEAHHLSAGNTYHKNLNRLWELNPNMKHLGVSATLFRSDKKSMDGIFDEVTFELTTLEAMSDGWLSPIEYISVETAQSLDMVGVSRGDFKVGELSQTVNTSERNELVVDSFLKAASERKSICFAVDVAHAKALAEAFRDNNIEAACVYGGTPTDERRGILQDLHTGKLQVVTNCMVLTEGFDEPSVDCLVLARPTKSKGLYIQMVGRGLRLYPGKQDCTIIDMQDHLSRHSLIGLADIDKKLEDAVDEAAIWNSKDDTEEPFRLDAVLAQNILHPTLVHQDVYDPSRYHWTENERGWAVSFGEGTLYVRRLANGCMPLLVKDWRIRPLATKPLPAELAFGIANGVLKNEGTEILYKPDALWRQSPASEKQIQALNRAGYRRVKKINKGRASDMLSQHFAEVTFQRWAKGKRLAA